MRITTTTAVFLLGTACGESSETPATVLHAVAPLPSNRIEDGGAADPDPTLDRALDMSGVRVDRARAGTLFRASCLHYMKCLGIEDLDACVHDQWLKWDFILRDYTDEVCLDTQLDVFACRATVSCDDRTTCKQLEEQQIARCSMPSPHDGG